VTVRLLDATRRALGAVRTVTKRLKRIPFLTNVFNRENGGEGPRALLVYLVESFLLPPDHPRFMDHQNLKQCFQIASVLHGAGFIVDVLDLTDRRNRPGTAYDLIISHRVDFGDGWRDFAASTNIYLATGMNHRIHNRNHSERHKRLLARRNCSTVPRTQNSEHMPFVQAVDGIAGFGNSVTAGSWKAERNVPLFAFNNYGSDKSWRADNDKDFETARRSFLFLASRNQIGKGLDLLLEIFPRHPELRLFVCSAFAFEKEFSRCYEKELFHTPNIQAVGMVRVDSDRYRSIIGQCAYVVLPTCAEGQPGSVVHGMHSGLVPLVTREAGIDTDDFGIMFTDDSLEAIERLIIDSATKDPGWVREKSRRTHEVAVGRYSEESFVNRWRDIIREVSLLRVKREVSR